MYFIKIEFAPSGNEKKVFANLTLW